MLRKTKRYQYATEGVRGDGTSRRKWFARLGFWRFKIDIDVFPEARDPGTTWSEPVRFDTLVRITVKYQDKQWIQQFYMPQRLYTITVTARMRVVELVRNIMARFTRAKINNSDIRITVKRKED